MGEFKITVATVCLNAEDTIRRTIDSVLDQDFDDFEYLIIDGKSKDSTINIIREYSVLFNEKSISYRYLSEKDNGLYDAMNKAASLAKGEWIIYMNSGDTLLDESVLSRVSSCFSENINILYGDILLCDGGKYKFHKAGKIDTLNKCFPIMHQACFTRVDIMQKYKFDTSYKISADYDFVLRLYNDDNSCIKKVDFVMSTFMMGGLSTTSILAREKDYSFARKKNNVKEPGCAKLSVFFMIIKEYLRLFTIKLLKDKFFNEHRGYYNLEDIKRKLLLDDI